MDIEKYQKDMLLNLSNIRQSLQLLSNVDSSVTLEKWYAVQILEHMYLVEQAIIMQMKHGKGIGFHDAEIILGAEKLERILIGMRSKKVASPEKFLPQGKFEHAMQALTELETHRKAWLLELQNGNLQIGNAIFEHPFLGKMTITDWLHFLHIHAQRHLLQIQDLA